MANGIFAGLATIDLVYAVDAFPAPNSKVAARRQQIFAGGPATNAAIAFAHLGGGTTLAAAVGRHPLAALIREELARFAIRLVDLTPAFDQPPAISSVSVNPAGERNVVSANAARTGAPSTEVDQAALSAADILMVDGHSMPACQAWARAARARGIPVVLDGGSWKAGTEELLENVDYAICSADFRPPGCHSLDEVVGYLQSRAVPAIAVTNGPGPIRHVYERASGFVPVPAVEPVDTMGAGDIFHGGFCFYLASGLSFHRALEGAARLAAHSCRFSGPRAWMAHLPE